MKSNRIESQAWVVMRRDRQVSPSSDETACHVSTRVLPGSRRRSYQMATRLPAGSESIHGKNWSLSAGCPVPVTLRNLASDHVAPPSVESWMEMSASDCGRLTLFW